MKRVKEAAASQKSLLLRRRTLARPTVPLKQRVLGACNLNRRWLRLTKARRRERHPMRALSQSWRRPKRDSYSSASAAYKRKFRRAAFFIETHTYGRGFDPKY